MVAEQLEQDRDALPRGQNTGNQDAQAAQGTSRNDYFRSGLRVRCDFNRFVVVDECAQIRHDRVAHRGHLFPEIDDAGDTRERVDLPPPLEIFELRKEVAGKKRFGRPEWLTRPHPAKANARGENFDRQLALQDERDFILLSRRGVEAIPVQRKGESEK